MLVMAGSLKRGYPDVDEDLTLIRALVDSNVPKFLADDLPLFAAIVKVREPYNMARAVGTTSCFTVVRVSSRARNTQPMRAIA